MSAAPDYENAMKIVKRLALTKVQNILQKLINGEEIFNTVPEFEDKKIIQPVAPVCDLITRNLKSELLAIPSKFKNAPKIWDLKTAYYMLHPDIAEKNFQALNDSLKTQQELEDMAAKLEGEILSYENLHDVMTKIDLPLIPV